LCHRHPPVPGKQLPIVIALVQLPEGVRMVGELLGVRPDPVRADHRFISHTANNKLSS